MATATQQPQTGLNFEQVWAALMEDREVRRIAQEKTDEAIKQMVDEHRKT